MTEYISATLGTIPEPVYEAAYSLRSSSFKEFEAQMKRFGYGYLRSGLLFLEIQKTTPDTLIGESIYNYLIKQEATKTQAINITRVLASSQTLINDIIEKGFRERDTAYGIDIKERLKSLGLVSRTIVAKAAREERITIYPILIIRPPPEIPPEEEIPPEICYRTQLAYLYIAKTKRKGTPEVVAEFRVWGESNQKGIYKIKYFDRVILQMERIMKGEGFKPTHWLNSLNKIIKASEEDEPIDCDEIKEMNYAQRGVAFRDEWGSEISFEYNEKWLKQKEKQLIDEGKLKCKFNNTKGILVYPDGTSCIRE